jgi:GTP cyclohydrolase I
MLPIDELHRNLIASVGEDPNRDGLLKTPQFEGRLLPFPGLS